MISVEGSSNEDLNTYAAMKEYVDTSELELIPVNIYDLRYATKSLISTLYIDKTKLNTASVNLFEHVLDGSGEIIGLKESIVYFGNRSLFNYVGPDGSFYFRDKLGGLTKSPHKNVMMWDIENNRSILDESIQIKMNKPENKDNFNGIAGIIRHQTSDNTKVDLTFSKYDKYSVTKRFKKILSIPGEATDIRFEDMEPKLMKLIDDAENDTYELNSDNMIIYTDLINTASLPKFKAVYTESNGKNKYYIFDTIRGNVPEFRTGELDSDPETLCLLDVYSDLHVNVNSLNSSVPHKFKLDYNMNPAGDKIFRTINVNDKDYYIKLANDEKELTGYIIIASNSKDTFEDTDDLLSDFSFSDIGLDTDNIDIYPIAYKKVDNSSVVAKWGINIQITETESFFAEFKKAEEETEVFSTFMDETELIGKIYFKLPVTIDINNDPTRIIENVMVTMRAKKVISANEYEFDTFGYMAVDTEEDFSIKKPIFTEYETEETKPYENISQYISTNNLT
jgi:hypothetical protein